MSEENEDEMDFYPRLLKKAGSIKIEETITKALSELAGEEYEVDLYRIDFEPEGFNGSAYLFDACEMQMKVTKKKKPY